jgi:hypothetical protein
MTAQHNTTDAGLDRLIACPQWRAAFHRLVEIWVETEREQPQRLLLLRNRVIFYDAGAPVTADDLITVFAEDLTALTDSIKRLDPDFISLWNYRELAKHLDMFTKYLEYEFKTSLMQVSRPKYVRLS